MELMIICIVVVFITIYIANQSGKVNRIKTKDEIYYENIKQGDPEFNQELEVIHRLITEDKCEDLMLISKEAKVSLTECIVKIRYLIKIGQLSDSYYIDHNNAIIKKCSNKEKELLKKYSNYIYQKKYQPNQIAKELHKYNMESYTFDEFMDVVFNDIKYLVENKLVNRIGLDEGNQKIIYPKKGNDYISKACPNCGAYNDVKRFHETRCKYCKSIIKD